MNYNFYVKKSELQAMKEVYSTSIEKLNKLYFEFEEVVLSIKDNNLWEGASFDSFVETFDKWKLKYLKSISRLITLKNFVEDLIVAMDTMVEERDSLL